MSDIKLYTFACHGGVLFPNIPYLGPIGDTYIGTRYKSNTLATVWTDILLVKDTVRIKLRLSSMRT